MADYIYLLENRLSRHQKRALGLVRDAARTHGMTVFLVGGAVRDLTSGAPIRDLNFVVQGDARQLRDTLSQDGKLLGSHELMQALYFSFPGGVRLGVSSSLAVSFPKPGKASVQPAPVLEDLRGRDFTVNAMAISLNEGSYGLLMDPTNGVADVESRELRLLSNYGFLEDPARMIRAIRLGARLGWQMEERTQTRYENAKTEEYIKALGDWERRYETEAIFREEDPVRTLRKLEAEGWVATLSPLLAAVKLDEAELDRLRDLSGQLNALGIFPDTSSAVFPLVTAKLSAGTVAELKQGFALSGFAVQIETLEDAARALSAEFTSKTNAAPSSAWNLLMKAVPEAVLWMAFSSKSAPVQSKLKLFFNEWPQAQQGLPYQQMQEMRITPDLPGYEALLEELFFAAMDGKLDSPEAIKAFLEPFSPPAAPPPPTLRRRAVKRETKATKSRSKKSAAEAEVVPDATGAELSDVETGSDEVSPASKADLVTPAERPAAATAKSAQQTAAKVSSSRPDSSPSGKTAEEPSTPTPSAKAHPGTKGKDVKSSTADAKAGVAVPAKATIKPPTKLASTSSSAVLKKAAPGKAAESTKPTSPGKPAAKGAVKAAGKAGPVKGPPIKGVGKGASGATSKTSVKKSAPAKKAVPSPAKTGSAAASSRAVVKGHSKPPTNGKGAPAGAATQRTPHKPIPKKAAKQKGR